MKTFLDLHPDFHSALFVVIPVRIGGTSVGLNCAENAPERIIEVSWQLEDYDTELKFNVANSGIITVSPCDRLRDLENSVLSTLDKGKIPIIIGGEHNITHVALKCMKTFFGKVSALFFDAHADMFDEFNGNKMSHACALYLSLPYLDDFLAVGIRNIAPRELENIRKLGFEEKFIFFEEIFNYGTLMVDFSKVERKLEQLKGDFIYISFDFDFMDPASMPSVSTPEPPGLYFRETLALLRLVIYRLGRKVRAADFVEFCPQGHFWADVSAAKLISKVIAYIYSFYNIRKGTE